MLIEFNPIGCGDPEFCCGETWDAEFECPECGGEDENIELFMVNGVDTEPEEYLYPYTAICSSIRPKQDDMVIVKCSDCKSEFICNVDSEKDITDEQDWSKI